MSITREAFAAWMEKYGQAWEGRNAEAAADPYAENGTYQVTPFVEPMQGRRPFVNTGRMSRKRNKTFNLDTRF